ncbi:hypothetical protein [Novosphingobium sp. 9]|uniref:hypothetical protein n=1 Tax=Novosphingobium sp. 9 TaxID=2025349 RepID=UPI0021B5E188|nr:hypothetical protein [Novosphingobium sp. 9]
MTMPQSLRLEMRDGIPVWRIEGWDGTLRTPPAIRGRVPAPVDAAYAARVAARFGHAKTRDVEEIARDQWTVASGFDRHRPLWKVSLADAAGTQLYISSTSGAVVQRTTAHQRFWNWLGAIPHWIYPTLLRQDNALWRQVVMWVSGPCIAAALTGIWVGVLRTRLGQRRYKGGRVTPYRGWMLWHHAAGMLGGLFLLTWIFSGWLSVDPGRVFSGSETAPDALFRYGGGNAPLPRVPLARWRQDSNGMSGVELTFKASLPRFSAFHPDGTRTVLTLDNRAVESGKIVQIERLASELVPDGKPVEAQWLRAPDAYWYSLEGLPQLPVLRLKFDDPARTWLELDPATGEILERLDSRHRTYRWLYDFLHRWDASWLTRHDTFRQWLIWAMSLPGLILSISGIRIGWKRLRSDM